MSSTNVSNLVIHRVDRSTYQSMVKNPNELYIITDELPVQLDVMPTAVQSLVGQIVQFKGTTDANYTNGYFYKCVSDGGNPATYSWSQVSVQPAGASYTAGNGISIDANNEISVADPVLVNKTPSGKDNLFIFKTGSAGANQNYSVCVSYEGNNSGYGARATGLGYSAHPNAQGSVAIGYRAITNANNAIQISGADAATNADANTFKVGNANGNYEIMSADGTIPADRLTHAINKYSTMPTASASNEGWIVQFTGTTDSTYTHGHLYECVSDGQTPATYSWTEVSMGGGGSSYTAGTGIDITGGVISVTAPTLKNVSPDLIDGLAITNSGSHGQGNFTTVLGVHAYIGQGVGQFSTVVGAEATSSSDNGIAIGWRSHTSAQSAIQIGCDWAGNGYDNSDANTFKVGNNNGNFMIMDANGNLPADRLASTTGLADGNYRLRLTMSNGTPTLSWVAE